MRNELAFENKNAAFEVAKKLIEENYVVMISKEETLTVLNYEFAWGSNRNEVVFMPEEEFDAKYIPMHSDDYYEDEDEEW